MFNFKFQRTVLQTALALACAVQMGPVFAHAERQAFFPNGQADISNPAQPVRHERPEYRPMLQAQRLVVCKKGGNESANVIARMSESLKRVNEQLLRECQFEHLQAAVDAVTTRGTTIYVLPGVYREEPSVAALDENFGAATPADRDFCQAVLARGPGKLTYEEQYRCRFIQNTVAIFGDPDYTDDDCGTDPEGVCTHPETQRCDPAKSACQYYDLQIEGTGEKITDVIFEGSFINKPGDPHDGQFKYLNGIRADRADGIYLRNFTTQIYEFNAVYVMETDGYVLDHLLSRYVDEYAFLSFASDHGLFDYTDGYGVADSVQYPGSGADIYKGANHATANLRQRSATEIRNSKGHHSSLAYSGTAGNAPWVHDNEFYKNQTGMATESIYGGHPGMPQDHALWERNKIYSNNKDYTKLIEPDGPCNGRTPRDSGVVPVEYKYFDTLPADYQEAILDRMVVCPAIPFPPGTAMVIAGGNYDVVAQNEVFDNWRWGLFMIAIPTLIHNLTEGPTTPLTPVLCQVPEVGCTVDDALGAIPHDGGESVTGPFFTAHFNRVLDNRFGENALGAASLSQPNGADILWDNSGSGNCFVGNTSKQGAVTTDLGPLGILGLPTDCADGNDPDLVNQTTTVRPNRLAEFVNCLNYNRRDASTKEGCPFFDPLPPPAGREGSAKVTSEGPRQIVRHDNRTQYGYFVLHNDTSATHHLKSATLRVQGGGVGEVSMVVTDIFGHSVSAKGVSGSDGLVFTFATPAEVPLANATAVEIVQGSMGVAMVQPAALFAGLGLGGVLLMVGGLSRRSRIVLAVALIATGALTACNGGGNDSKAKAQLELTQLEFSESSADASYAGLPLIVGEVR